MECVLCHQEIKAGEEVYQVKRGIYKTARKHSVEIEKTYLEENLCHSSCLLRAGIDLACLMFDLER